MAEVTCMKRGKTWQYRFEGAKVGGERQRHSKGGFATKKEALNAGTKALSEYNNSGLVFVPSEISFSDYLDFWFKEYCLVSLKLDTTCPNYKKKIDNHIRPALGKYRLRSLTPAVLQQFLNEKFNQGYSHNTLLSLKGLLSGCLSYAVEPLKFIQVCPMQGVKLPSSRATPEVPTRKKEKEIVTEEKWNAIIKRFPFGHSCYIPLLLAYRCGLRLGEAFAVTWDDIDFREKTLDINKQVQESDGYWTFSNPKYDSFRVIKLDKYMLEELKKAKELQDRAPLFYAELYTHLYENARRQIVKEKGDDCKEIRLVNVRENGTYIQPRVMTHCGRVVHYDLGYMSYDYHSLRHTHATVLLENGANVKDVQHRLGHKNIEVTLQIYAHVTKKMQSQTVEIMDEIPVSGSCTPDLSQESLESTNFSSDSLRIYPSNTQQKLSAHATSDDAVPPDGVQACTPNETAGYKWGTEASTLSFEPPFESKKRAAQ